MRFKIKRALRFAAKPFLDSRLQKDLSTATSQYGHTATTHHHDDDVVLSKYVVRNFHFILGWLCSFVVKKKSTDVYRWIFSIKYLYPYLSDTTMRWPCHTTTHHHHHRCICFFAVFDSLIVHFLFAFFRCIG